MNQSNLAILAALLFGLLSGCDSSEPRAMMKSEPPPGAYAIVDLSGGPDAASYPVTFAEELPAEGTPGEHKTAKLILRWIKPGKFRMGGALLATPVQDVTLTSGFYMALYEVTQGQWENVMGLAEFHFEGKPAHPAEMISWEAIRGPLRTSDWPAVEEPDGASFMGRLTAKVAGLHFDLPTESQWEFACRAGTSTAWSFGDTDDEVDDHLWSDDNSDGETQEVGTLKPNPWGLYDLHGNVAEWCLDRHGPYRSEPQTDPVGAKTGWSRTWRGGAWDVTSYLTQSAGRSGGLPDDRYPQVGFRPIALSTK